jgi:hypothetical protein
MKKIKEIKKKEKQFGISSLSYEELKMMRDYYYKKSQILYKNSTIYMIVAIAFQVLALTTFFIRLFFY